MTMTSRWVRWAGVFGLGMLVITLVAASHFFQGPTPLVGQTFNKNAASAPGVYCTGKVDVEPSLQKLLPQQLGAVIEVYVKDGDKVKAGAPLLKINDEPYVVKEAEAEVGIRIAESKLAQARQALTQNDEQVKGLEAAVAATKQAVVIATQSVTYLERQLANNPREKQAVLDGLVTARAELKAREAAVTGKEAELQAAKNARPTNVVKEAEGNVALQTEKLREAKEARARCTLRAPVDGTILRVDAAKGTVFGPQGPADAMIFAPNGEWFVRLDVDQEYAYRIAPRATAVIFDESNVAHKWVGEVARVGDAYLPPRKGVSAELISMGNDARKLEVIVRFKNLTPGDVRVRLGQNMTVRIESAEQATARATP